MSRKINEEMMAKLDALYTNIRDNTELIEGLILDAYTFKAFAEVEYLADDIISVLNDARNLMYKAWERFYAIINYLFSDIDLALQNIEEIVRKLNEVGEMLRRVSEMLSSLKKTLSDLKKYEYKSYAEPMDMKIKLSFETMEQIKRGLRELSDDIRKGKRLV